MNILKHKSWHVYNEKNRERVRRDEQQLAEEEEKERERALLAEKERRLAALRAKSRSGDGAVETREDLDVAAATSGTSIYSGKHINFWASLETEAGNGKIVNEEREEEKRKEKEAADRKTTSYLSREPEPWYSKPKETKKGESQSSSKKRHADREDPKHIMDRARGRDREEHRGGFVTKSSSSSKSSESSASKSDTMAKLREERLRRERMEQDRVRALGLGPKQPAFSLQDERNAGYSSAFHPELHRKKARFQP